MNSLEQVLQLLQGQGIYSIGASQPQQLQNSLDAHLELLQFGAEKRYEFETQMRQKHPRILEYLGFSQPHEQVKTSVYGLIRASFQTGKLEPIRAVLSSLVQAQIAGLAQAIPNYFQEISEILGGFIQLTAHLSNSSVAKDVVREFVQTEVQLVQYRLYHLELEKRAAPLELLENAASLITEVLVGGLRSAIDGGRWENATLFIDGFAGLEELSIRNATFELREAKFKLENLSLDTEAKNRLSLRIEELSRKEHFARALRKRIGESSFAIGSWLLKVAGPEPLSEEALTQFRRVVNLLGTFEDVNELLFSPRVDAILSRWDMGAFEPEINPQVRDAGEETWKFLFYAAAAIATFQPTGTERLLRALPLGEYPPSLLEYYNKKVSLALLEIRELSSKSRAGAILGSDAMDRAKRIEDFWNAVWNARVAEEMEHITKTQISDRSISRFRDSFLKNREIYSPFRKIATKLGKYRLVAREDQVPTFERTLILQKRWFLEGWSTPLPSIAEDFGRNIGEIETLAVLSHLAKVFGPRTFTPDTLPTLLESRTHPPPTTALERVIFLHSESTMDELFYGAPGLTRFDPEMNKLFGASYYTTYLDLPVLRFWKNVEQSALFFLNFASLGEWIQNPIEGEDLQLVVREHGTIDGEPAVTVTFRESFEFAILDIESSQRVLLPTEGKIR